MKRKWLYTHKKGTLGGLAMVKGISFSIFTKPWRTITAEKLGEFVSGLGFDGVEFPLRDGYQAEPANAERDLPKLVKTLGDYGVKIMSVASGTSENIFAACAESGIPLIRIMGGHDLSGDYMQTEAELKRTIEGFLPLCEKYKVKVGMQQHCGPGVNNTMEMLHLVEQYDANYVGGIWDAAHSGMAGEEPEQAIDIIWSHLLLANFKNAYIYRTNGPEAAEAEWGRHFTTGANGQCSWRRAIAQLKKRGYTGTFCLPAEYTDEHNVEKYIAIDIEYIKSLVNEIY